MLLLCDHVPQRAVSPLKHHNLDIYIYAQGVPAARQKLMAKGAWKGILKDDVDLSGCTIKDGQQVCKNLAVRKRIYNRSPSVWVPMVVLSNTR